MSNVSNPKELHKFVRIAPPPVADLIMVDYVQPLALQALTQKKEPISAALKSKVVHLILWKLMISVLG